MAFCAIAPLCQHDPGRQKQQRRPWQIIFEEGIGREHQVVFFRLTAKAGRSTLS
jgi:hypothetical protein